MRNNDQISATRHTYPQNGDASIRGTNAHLLAELDFIRSHQTFTTAMGKVITGWDTRRGSDLLKLAGEKLAGTARRQGMDELDAAAAAWQVWKGSTEVHSATNPWGWTRQAVKRELAREHRAQRLLTSVAAMRRDDFVEPEQDHFADLELAASIATPKADDRQGGFKTLALRTAVILLTKHGHTKLVAESMVEALLDAAVVGATTPKMAADVLTRSHTLRSSFDMASPEWNALVALLFGSRRGEMGSVEAELTGVDPASVAQIVRAQKRFEGASRLVG
ncbi:hypothetical protein ACVXZ4_08355 [Lacisediminihabitans sp. FW035]